MTVTATYPVGLLNSGLQDATPILAGLTPEAEAAGIAASTLVGPEGPIIAVLGGVLVNVLSSVLGGQGPAISKVQAAIDQALAANVAGNTQQQLDMGAQVYGEYKISALLAEASAGAAYAAAQAMQRVTASAATASDLSLRTDVITWFTQLENAINAVRAQNLAMVEGQIGQLRGDTIAWIDQLNLATQQARAQLSASDRAYTDGEVAGAAAQARHDAQVIEGWVTTVAADLIAYADQLNATTTAELQAVEAWAQGQIVQANQYAEQAAADAGNQAMANLSQETSTALAPVWAGTAESVNAATSTLATQHPDQASGLSLLSTSVPVDAATALAGLAVSVKTLAQTATDCALPNCASKNKLGHDLSSIAKLFSAGLFMAFIEESVRDPSGTAHDVIDVLGPIADPITSAVKSLIGL